jgi:SAM-dependent methyltransferase
MQKIESPWAQGDFHVIGVGQLLVGELLCDDIDLTAGNAVLDIACGSGNTALAAARRGNDVTGLDLIEALVERARRRAEAEGFSIEFVTGNAEALPFADASFDVVLSTFGVMFAPNQQLAADEMLRVCKPGGIIGLATWTPESAPGAMFRLTSKYLPPRPGATPPIAGWGNVPGLKKLFGDRIAGLRLVDHSVRQRFESVDAWIATFREYFGPVRQTFAALEGGQQAAYERDLRELIAGYNRATDGSLAVAMSYLNVIAEKKA